MAIAFEQAGTNASRVTRRRGTGSRPTANGWPLVHAAGGGVSDSLSSLIRSGSASGCHSPMPASAAPAYLSVSKTTNGCGTTSTFWLSVFNTLLYTTVASTIKFAVGLYLALLLNENLPFKAILRALVLVPFIVPTVLSAIAFWWLFDPQFSIISWSLRENRPDHCEYRFSR